MSWLSDRLGIKWNPLKDIQNLFSAPKITLPTIPEPVPQKQQAPLPVIEPAKGKSEARKRGTMDIGAFSTNLTPTIQAILGLSLPPVSPGLMIPGA